jgi:hypothetical protein
MGNLLPAFMAALQASTARSAANFAREWSSGSLPKLLRMRNYDSHVIKLAVAG